MKPKIFVYILSFLLGFTTIHAQNKTTEGNIVAFKKYVLKNVSVSCKKTKDQVVSDSLGHFSIVCGKKDELIIDAAGFETQYFKIKDQNHLNVNMILIQNEEAYKDVVTKGHMTKEVLDYCISNLLVDNNNFDQLSNIYDVIQYVYPSADIVEVSSEFSNSEAQGKQIVLDARGVNSFNASPYALLVVDGMVVNDISGVSPLQVKSVKVLNRNEAGHWGSRGGNGAVEITLKYK